jgi:hypothetical protein
MQWNGVQSNPDRPAPLRSLMELLQKKAEPYVTEYGENQLPGAGQLLNSILRTGTEMVPGVGDLLGAEDLQTAAQNNDWGGIGLGALAAIPGIPSFSRGAGGDIRATGRAVREAAEAMPAQYADPSTGAIEVEVLPPEPDYPIRAFHGSPHSFDRFSLDKIGTGEGAQAYGHGLYFAESEDVARGYRNQLSGFGVEGAPIDGSMGDYADPAARAARKLAEFTARGGDRFSLGQNLLEQRRALDAKNTEFSGLQAQAIQDEITALFSDAPLPAVTSQGSMYEVGINADPNTFLDWDRPLSEQPAMMERFRSDAAEPLFGRIPWGDRQIAAPSPDQTPWQVIKEYEDLRGPAGVREALQNLGINGVRYLDGNSRYAPDLLPDNPIANEARQWLDVAQGDSAEALRQFNASNPIERFAGPERDEVRRVIEAAARRPTSNYVVFNDDLVKILRKYGIGGLSTTVGASALAEELDRRERVSQF